MSSGITAKCVRFWDLDPDPVGSLQHYAYMPDTPFVLGFVTLVLTVLDPQLSTKYWTSDTKIRRRRRVRASDNIVAKPQSRMDVLGPGAAAWLTG